MGFNEYLSNCIHKIMDVKYIIQIYVYAHSLHFCVFCCVYVQVSFAHTIQSYFTGTKASNNGAFGQLFDTHSLRTTQNKGKVHI